MSDGAALSVLDWWAEAGVDTMIDEIPRDWLAAPAAAESAAPSPAAVAPAPPPVAALPTDLAGFRRWLLSDAGVPGPPARRLDAAGDPASATMLVIDMPEADDLAAGALLSGEAGALFDRMLVAIGLDRAAIYLAPFAPARPATGRIGDADCAALALLMRHHLALVRPQRLLLLGDGPARALTGLPLAQARGAVRQVESAAGTIPAIASFHPRFVLGRPDYRRPAWADLQLFMAL